MDLPVTTFTGLASALGLGMLIGLDRERRKDDDHPEAPAGVRTHALLALAGSVAMLLGPWALALAAAGVLALAVASYLRAGPDSTGLTGEVAILLTFLLGALAIMHPALAAGLGVAVAVLLASKTVLHRLTREWLTENEMRDLLVLAAAGLIVMPLLPDRAVDPWGVIVPASLGRLAMLVMGVGVAGHLALRIVGARWGLPIAGFFAGFASSTAATAGFGQRAKATPAVRTASVAAAMFANLASLMLFAGIIGTGSLILLELVRWPLLAAGTVLAGAGALGLWHAPRDAESLPEKRPAARAFRLSHALLFVAIVAGMLVLSAWLGQRFGSSSVLAASMFVALAELHAAAASVAQMFHAGTLAVDVARWGVVGMLAASVVAKSVVAFSTGGPAYGLRVTAGLVAMLIAAASVTWLVPPGPVGGAS